MAEGRDTQDPMDEATPQPSQEGTAGSAPRGPPMELGVSEDTSSGVPSVMATTLHTLLGPTAGAGRLFLHSLERALDTSQQWLNHYLPPGERQEVAESAEGPVLASARVLRHSRLLPLGSLSGDARSRAAALVQQFWQERLDTHHLLAQHILDVMEAMQQQFEEPLDNSQERWEHRNRAQANPCPHPACPDAGAKPPEGCRTPAMPQALAAARMLAQRLQDALVQAARRAQRGVAELRGVYSRAGSLQELLGTAVARGREVVAQAWEALVVFLLQHLSLPRLEDAAAAASRAAPSHPQN